MIQETAQRHSIREFIKANMNMLDDDVQLADDHDIFALGFVNSMFAMRLLDFVEKECDVTVGDDDIQLANFSSVDAMMGLVSRLQTDG